MSRRHAVESRLRVYHELHEIMGAMKNIALIESRKLARVLESQRAMCEIIERSAEDFFAYHPELLMRGRSEPTLIVAIGSERGSCGSFNMEVEQRLRTEVQRCRQPPCVVLAGSRLVQRAEGLAGVTLRLEGPAMMEDVRPALARLLDALSAQPDTERSFTLQGLGIVHHVPHDAGGEVRFYHPWSSSDGNSTQAPPLQG